MNGGREHWSFISFAIQEGFPLIRVIELIRLFIFYALCVGGWRLQLWNCLSILHIFTKHIEVWSIFVIKDNA